MSLEKPVNRFHNIPPFLKSYTMILLLSSFVNIYIDRTGEKMLKLNKYEKARLDYGN
jgi:hypothetical protein